MCALRLFYRFDYENVDSAGAAALMAHLNHGIATKTLEIQRYDDVYVGGFYVSFPDSSC